MTPSSSPLSPKPSHGPQPHEPATVAPSADAAHGMLQAPRVILLAHNDNAMELGTYLAMLLRKTGGIDPLLLSQQQFEAWCAQTPGSSARDLLVSLSFGQECPEERKNLDAWCKTHAWRWLRFALAPGSYVDIGPLFRPPVSACYQCFFDIHVHPVDTGVKDSKANSPEPYKMWLALLAMETIDCIGQSQKGTTAKGAQRFRAAGLSSIRLRTIGMPGCQQCRPLKPESMTLLKRKENKPYLDIAIALEESVGLPSRLESSRGTNMAAAKAAQAASLGSLGYQHGTRIELGDLTPSSTFGLTESLQQKAAPTNAPLNLDTLGYLISRIAGVRPETPQKSGSRQRWTATAGNLGSVSAFVIAKDVVNLPGGIYSYAEDSHTLVKYDGRSTGPFVEMIASHNSSLPEAEVAAWIILVSSFHRVRRKYGAFAQRLVSFDAGVALSQLHLLSNAIGIPCRTLAWWDDALVERLLNLRVQEEQVAAMISFPKHTAGNVIQHRRDHPSVSDEHGRRVTHHLPGDYCGLGEDGIAALWFRESRMSGDSPTARTIDAFSPAATQPHTSLERVPLPAHESCDRPVSSIMAQRRSVRRFSQRAVTMVQLSTILHAALNRTPKNGTEFFTEDAYMAIWVLPRNLQGLKPAGYRYDGHGHLDRLTEELSQTEREELFVQEEFPRAPLVFWVTGNVAQASQDLGAIGHRKLLVRAGECANDMWMAAIGSGLEGSLVAGVVPGAARRVLGMNGYTEVSLLALAVGWPPI